MDQFFEVRILFLHENTDTVFNLSPSAVYSCIVCHTIESPELSELVPDCSLWLQETYSALICTVAPRPSLRLVSVLPNLRNLLDESRPGCGKCLWSRRCIVYISFDNDDDEDEVTRLYLIVLTHIMLLIMWYLGDH